MLTFTSRNSVFKIDEDRKVYIRFPRKEHREYWENRAEGPFVDGQWIDYSEYKIRNNQLLINTEWGWITSTPLEQVPTS